MNQEDEDLEYLVKVPIVEVHIDRVIEDAMNRVRIAEFSGRIDLYRTAIDYYNKLEETITNPETYARGWYNPNDKTYFYEKVYKR